MIKNCFIYSTLLLLLLACKPEYTKNKTILEAEKVLFNSPDSAYKLLKSINQPEKLPEADYAAWCLHYVHARYKLYLNKQNDSALLNLATIYYEKNGSEKYAGTALYLKGCFALLEKKQTNAINCLKKSAQLLEKTDDEVVLGLVYLQLSQLYLAIEVDYESKFYINKAITCFTKSKNEVYAYYAYRTNAEILLKTEEPVKMVISEIEKSEKLSLKYKDTIFYNDLLIFKAQALVNIDRTYSKSLLLKAFSKINNKSDQITAYLCYIYAQQGQLDSALYYHKLIQPEDISKIDEYIYEVSTAYAKRTTIDSGDAFSHLEKAFIIKLNRFSQSNKTLLLNIDKQFDYTQKEQERAKLEIANQQKIILIIILFVLILIGVIIQLQISNRNKLKQKKMELEQQQMQHEITNRKHENAQNLAIIQANIQNKIENTLKFKKLNTGITNKEKVDLFLNEITLQSVVSENELTVYMNEADKLFGNRISTLKSKFPKLTSSDLIVISLICLGINYNDCAHLLNISINTLYTRRKRIKSHMGFDKTVDLEEWIALNIIKTGTNT